ncbi:MAG: phosphoribosylformylglycinamidine synthase I [Ectothiorhodospiraceae bacterium]|nr:phosphoribosylformylglycinamidine synthase I [Ectothiorhodospiraceae bacterium]
MTRPRFGIVVFPGSNCDHDAYHVAKHVMDRDAVFLWHKDTDLQDSDVIIIPGGFSYGDYLRGGAIAQFSPIITEVRKHAERGGLVVGICNGFQVLTEASLLPGALIRNASRRFVCKEVFLKVENGDTAFTSKLDTSLPMRLHVAHGEGNYYADPDTLKRLEDENRVVFRYTDPTGNPTPESNPNGSSNNIAGIINERGNVLGMMPHPERCSESILGSVDGRGVFESMVDYIIGERVEATA